MARITLPLNTNKTIVVNNGVARSFIFGMDGTFTSPNSVYIGNTTNAYRAILSAANIATSDKTFTFNNRGGTLALEDLTSLLAMVPSVTGNSGKVLGTDGTTLNWVSAGTSSLISFNGIATASYNAQTLAIGTTGTAPNWVSQNSNTNTHTLHIPMASTASVTAGLLSNADYAKIGFKDGNNTWSGTNTFTNAPTITNPSTASNAVATYGQVQAATLGISLRLPAVVNDSVNTTRPTVNPVIDGRTIALGDRVLFTALSLGTENNRVWKATGSLNPVTWVLETDGRNGDGSPSGGEIITVVYGTNNGNTQYMFDGTVWGVLYSPGSVQFGTGLAKTGEVITVDFAASGTSSATQAVRADDSRLSNSRTPTAHVLDSATHTISGKTAGQVLLATGATTYAFTTISGDLGVSGTGVVTISKINNVAINDLGLQQNSTTLADNTSAATLVTGCSWAIATYRTIKIEYSISRGAGNYTTGRCILIHDGTTPRLTWDEEDSIGTHGVTFSTDINGGNIRLLYQTTSTGTAATMKFINYTFGV